jgi:hypothetical protein
MEEVKARIAAITYGLGGFNPRQPAFIESEFCYLQLRLICDTIAIACLVAHGDHIERALRDSLADNWRINKMFERLSTARPNFFPIPFTQKPLGSGGFEHIPIRTGALTQDGFLALYDECSNVVHRGTLSRVLSGNSDRFDRSKVIDWQRQIMTLLSCHEIWIATEEKFYAVVMQASSDGRVHLSEMVRES